MATQAVKSTGHRESTWSKMLVFILVELIHCREAITLLSSLPLPEIVANVGTDLWSFKKDNIV